MKTSPRNVILNPYGRYAAQTPTQCSTDTRRMARWIVAGLSLLINGVVMAQSAQNAAYPQSATLVPWTDKANLQARLNTYRVIRLEKGDYATGGPSSITLSSNQEIYGFPAENATVVPPINVAAGTTNAVVQSVNSGTLNFLSGAPITTNLFKRIGKTKFFSTGASVENNLFLALRVGLLNVDNSGGGYFKNNRIIRLEDHGAGIGTGNHLYGILLKGNSSLTSGNNVFLDTIFLTPKGDTVYADNQTDLTFASWNIESWCYADAGYRAMQTGPMGTFRMFNGGGGDHDIGSASYGVLDIAATNFVDFGNSLVGNQQTATTYDLTLEQGNVNSLVTLRTFGWSVLDNNPSGTRIDAFNLSNTNFAVNGSNYTSTLPTTTQTTMRNLVMSPRTGGAYWEAPVYDSVPDPGGPGWNVNLASKPDNAALLQGYIDNDQIIPPGIYYIGASLKVKDSAENGHPLRGSGQGNTCIIAKNSTIDMVVGDDHADPTSGYTALTPVCYNISDVTFQGGHEGFVTNPAGSGAWASVSGAVISHVTFRNMSATGIHADKVCDWDNNLLDNCYFVDCAAAGFQQTVDPNYTSGMAAGMCFVDKVMFYRCQFIRCGIAADMPGVRQDNLDGFISCLFQDSTIRAVTLERNQGTSFANCDFVGNAGNPTIYLVAGGSQAAQFMSCYFKAPATGVSSVFGTQTVAEGCTFDRNGNTSAVINGIKANLNSFYNCTSLDMPLGTVTKKGLFYNNYFPSDPAFSKEAVALVNGTIYTLMPNTTTVSSPQPQILYGAEQPQKFGIQQ